MTYQIVLKREGHAVLEANGQAAALQILQKDTPDVLLTCMKLSDGTGAELIRLARSMPDRAELRILAFGEESARAEALAAGAQIYEKTPLKAEALVKAVSQLFSAGS